MKGLKYLVAVLCLTALVSFSCDAKERKIDLRVVEVSLADDLNDMFVLGRDKWLGGDAAYSIPLSDSTILWIFGDTFLGRVEDGIRYGEYSYVNNTIGIQSGFEPADAEMRFFYRWEGEKPISFFPKHENTPGHYTWPTNGFILEDKLFLFGYAMAANDTTWWIDGTTLLVINNPYDPPMEWDIEYGDFGHGNNHQGFFTAFYLTDEQIYFIGYDDGDDGRRTVLARAKPSDFFEHRDVTVLEYFSEDSAGQQFWSDEADQLAELYKPGVTESHIQYLEEYGLFVMTSYGVFSPEINITWAPEITGPWAEPITVYTNPDHKKMTYAARLHPEFSKEEGELIISYINAPMTLDLTVEPNTTYVPRFIRVMVEPVTEAAE